MSLKKTLIALGVLVLVGGAAGGYYFRTAGTTDVAVYKTPEEKDNAYVRFTLEAYDTIVENYWSKVDEASFSDHIKTSLNKALENSNSGVLPPPLLTRDRAGVAKMLQAAFNSATSTESQKQLALDTLVVALYNMPPVGRNGILSTAQETAFREEVANVDQSKDLYKDLGLEKGASEKEVTLAYETRAKELEKDSSPEAKAELEKISYAKDVLSNPNTKDLYDVAKVEPTASNDVIGKTLYIKIDRVSPTTLLEFGRTVISASTTPLNSMIIDLRGNLGGALDFAQHFLGLFLGQNQYAFDLFHQDEYNVQRTAQPKFPELARYKEIVLLTDSMTQSTAEVTSAAFKRFKLGTVIGETTRGWGTVENTFPLKTVIDPTQAYSVLLVHSITLRDDGEPVEGRGVDPHIDIKDPNWKSKLSNFIDSPDLIQAVKSRFDK